MFSSASEAAQLIQLALSPVSKCSSDRPAARTCGTSKSTTALASISRRRCSPVHCLLNGMVITRLRDEASAGCNLVTTGGEVVREYARSTSRGGRHGDKCSPDCLHQLALDRQPPYGGAPARLLFRITRFLPSASTGLRLFSAQLYSSIRPFGSRLYVRRSSHGWEKATGS